MKAKVIKLLHLFGFDVLLLGFVEKLFLGLSKKFGEWRTLAENSLNRCTNRNE